MLEYSHFGITRDWHSEICSNPKEISPQGVITQQGVLLVVEKCGGNILDTIFHNDLADITGSKIWIKKKPGPGLEKTRGLFENHITQGRHPKKKRLSFGQCPKGGGGGSSGIQKF